MVIPKESEREFLERRYRESIEAAQRSSDPALVRAYRGFAEQYRNALARLSIEQDAQIIGANSIIPGEPAKSE